MFKQNKTISVLGCGWFGLPFAAALVNLGYKVKGSTTTAEKVNILGNAGIMPYLINLDSDEELRQHEFFECDILICCIPPKRNPEIQQLYPTKIKQIARTALWCKVKEFILISSTSVFGDQNKTVDENQQPIPDTAAGKVILDAEQFLQQYKGLRSTIVRFAGLFGPNRDPGRFFAGKTAIPNGEAPVNLIELADCIGILTSIVEQEKFGTIYHACSPEHPSRRAFYTAAAKRALLPLPEFILEKSRWKIVASTLTRVQLSYEFQIKLNTLVNQ